MSESKDSMSGVCVGIILGAHGVNGLLNIKSFCNISISIQEYGKLKVEGSSLNLNIKIISQHKDVLRVSSCQIKDRESALKLKGKLLFADRIKLPELDQEEYYVSDLIGLTAKDTRNCTFGIVVDVQDYGAGSYLEIKSQKKAQPILIPFDKRWVPIVSISEGYIILSKISDESFVEQSGLDYK